MSDAVTDINDSGTTDQTTDASASADASSSGSGEASLWESRFKGLNAKFGTTQTELQAEKEARAKAEAELEALRTGKVSAEEAAKSQVEQARAELEAERKARRIDSLKAKFPEAFGELGDEIASVMDEARLTAIEARLGGGESPAGDPTPRKHNESRSATSGKKPESEKTAADIEAELLSMTVPWAR